MSDHANVGDITSDNDPSHGRPEPDSDSPPPVQPIVDPDPDRHELEVPGAKDDDQPRRDPEGD